PSNRSRSIGQARTLYRYLDCELTPIDSSPRMIVAMPSSESRRNLWASRGTAIVRIGTLLARLNHCDYLWRAYPERHDLRSKAMATISYRSLQTSDTEQVFAVACEAWQFTYATLFDPAFIDQFVSTNYAPERLRELVPLVEAREICFDVALDDD